MTGVQWIAAAIAALVLAIGVMLYLANDQTSAEPAQSVIVERVIDGDTFTARTETGEDLGRIRVLGIDTPERARDGQVAQCHAEEATTAAEQLLQGQSVQISRDPSQDRRDFYDRLLVYVDVNGQDFSEVMLAQGHARTYSGPAIARQRDYDAAASAAEDQGVGIWGNCP